MRQHHKTQWASDRYCWAGHLDELPGKVISAERKGGAVYDEASPRPLLKPVELLLCLLLAPRLKCKVRLVSRKQVRGDGDARRRLYLVPSQHPHPDTRVSKRLKRRAHLP